MSPISLSASLSHQQIVTQMTNVCKATQRPQDAVAARIKTFPGKLQSHVGRVLICNGKTSRWQVVRVIPLGRYESGSSVAVAVTADGSRLFLRAVPELPLLPKRLETTHNPEMYVAN